MNPYEINDRNLKDILAVYEDAYKEVAKNLKKNLSYKSNPYFSKVSQYMIDKYVETRFRDLAAELKKVVPRGVETAVSVAYTEAVISKHIKDGLTNIQFEKVLHDTMRITRNGRVATELSEITMKDLLQVTNNTEYAVKRLIRETFSKHLTVKNMLNRGQKQLADRVIKELSGKKLESLIDSNMTGIVDRAGRRWKVTDYVDMAVKTKFHQAHVKGVQEFIEEYDGHGDLARIPKNQSTVDTCKHYEGLIISMTGRTPGYRTYEELKATNLIFHPRCRHNPVPYWDEDSIPKSTMLAHKRVNKKLDKLFAD